MSANIPAIVSLFTAKKENPKEQQDSETYRTQWGSIAADIQEVECIADIIKQRAHELFEGKWEGAQSGNDIIDNIAKGYPSQSEADLGLCSMIAHEAVKQGVPKERLHATVDEVYRKSGLMRDKWEKRRKYREHTIKKAVESALLMRAPIAAAVKSSIADLIRLQPVGDILSGRVFAAKNGGLLLYVNAAGKWIRWDGLRWVWCETGEEMQAAKQVADLILDQTIAEYKKKPELFGSRLTYAKALQGIKRLEAMVELTKSEDGMAIGSPTDLDSHPDLLGVRNGVVNLDTGELLEPDPSLLMTRQAAAHYHQGAQCPRWLQFLDEIFDADQDVIAFSQRALGYSLTGHNTEEIIIICHGFGANGKSIFSNVVTSVAGDYALTAPSSILVRRDNETGPRNDLAQLCGSRIVQINETQSGERLDERVVKLLAGREPISARFLYREHFVFTPTFTAWLRTNHKPIITGTDDGIWRRLVLLAFRRQFKGEDADPWLEQKLLDERDGILAWMIDGAREWYRNGLQIPSVIRDGSNAYRTESDVLGEFLADETVNSPTGRVEQTTLWGKWQFFCGTVGVSEGSKNSFTRRLAERSYEAVKSHGVRYYKGLEAKR